jgi:phage tail-like protein
MATDTRNDPFLGCYFALEIDGVPSGGFAEVSGLTAEAKAVDYREGTDRQSNPRKLMGPASYGTVKLTRGYTKDNALWKWYSNILNGQPDRRNVTIVLMNEAREPQLRFNLIGVGLTKIDGPSFKASGNEVAMESVELVHEGLTLEV